METSLTSLVDYKVLEEETQWGTGWMDTVSDSVSRWGSWFSGKNPPAPAPTVPEVELQTFSGQINEIPENQERLLGGHVEEDDGGHVEEAEWGADDDLPGGDFDLEEKMMELEAPPRVRRRTFSNSKNVKWHCAN